MHTERMMRLFWKSLFVERFSHLSTDRLIGLVSTSSHFGYAWIQAFYLTIASPLFDEFRSCCCFLADASPLTRSCSCIITVKPAMDDDRALGLTAKAVALCWLAYSSAEVAISSQTSAKWPLLSKMIWGKGRFPQRDGWCARRWSNEVCFRGLARLSSAGG